MLILPNEPNRVDNEQAESEKVFKHHEYEHTMTDLTLSRLTYIMIKCPPASDDSHQI
jgi:hypothetical protein